MEKNEFFSYSWHLDEDETNRTVIRIYGLNPKNENVCVIVNNFLPYAYLELPDTILWNDAKASLVASRLNSMLGENKPVTYKLEYKKRLYYANLDKKLSKRIYPYIQCCCSHPEDIRQLGYKIRRPINIPGIGAINLKIHEHNASPILQLTSKQKLPTAGWISFLGKKIAKADQITHCEHEYIVKCENLQEKNSNVVARPLMMGYDIEVNSSIPSSMPKAHRPDDKIFQISCVFGRQGSKPDTYEKYILSLGEPDPDMLDDIEIRMYDTESDLLLGFTEIIQEKQPNIIIGYNIFTFDIPYMIDRAKLQYCIYDFDRQGMTKYGHAKERNIEWSSSAYKNQSFQFLDAEGRIFVDLLPLVKRDYKMNNYKLKTIASHFLKDMTKDPLDAKGIFKCYRLGMQGGPRGRKALAIVGKYCVKDSELVVRLCETLTTWFALCEMSKVTNVPIFSLYTQGQQLKVFSNAYKKCTHENIVVEKDAYVAGENDHYVGATVFPPIPGVYEKVVPFDFCLAGDTLVSLSTGVSKRIETFGEGESVLACVENGLGNFKSIHGLQKKGKRETVKIWLQDGTTVISTPDHKFMLEDGSWCRADSLKDKYVKCGLEFPEDIICPLEKDWKIVDLDNREMLLAFSRMLGYILTDGTVYMSKNRKCVEAYFGTMFDAINFKNDVKLFSDVDVGIRKRGSDEAKKGITYSFSLPKSVSDKIHKVCNVVGKRTNQAMKLPDFILDQNCPLSVVREFLGGLFGGDGTAPYYSSRSDKFGSISFKWTTIEKYMEPMIETVNNIGKLLKRFDIVSTVIQPMKVKYSVKPKDCFENPRWDIQLNIPISYTLSFSKCIGFRYCVNKSCRSTLISSYEKMKEKTREQHSRVFSKTLKIVEEEKITTRKSLEKARDIVFRNEPVINEYSLSSVRDIGYQKHESIRHAHRPRKLSLQKKKFPSAFDYMKETGTVDWFNIGNGKSYSVKREDSYIPVFRKKVIDVKVDVEREVYDIEVSDAHNFLANGTVAHNCSLYPSTIIAYNISWDTLVLDNDIPDDICHVMEWEDHINCEHDPKEIRKSELNKIIKEKESVVKELRKERDLKKNKDRKEEFKERIDVYVKEMKPFRDERSQLQKSKAKHLICCKRKYRWLKSPMGVLPEILTHLLETRSATKKEMKKVAEKLKEMKEDTPEYNEMSTYHDVLDQRQLALKVSSNSGYGCLGVKRGYLPLMPGAMATTYMGRKAIEKAAESIQKDWGGVLVYGDSVSGDTPILVKYPNGSINLQTIDTLGNEWVDYDQYKSGDKDRNGKEQSFANLEVWTNGKWSRIRKVIRHKTVKKMYRILTHTGCVDVTEDHSLLREDGEKVKPTEVKIGEPLLHSFPSTFEEFETEMVEGVFNTKKCKKCNEIVPEYEFYTDDYKICKKCCYYTNHRNKESDNIKPYFSDYEYKNKKSKLTKEEAFVWGFFMADGSGGKYESGKHSWAINNQNLEYLNRAKTYLEQVEPNYKFKILDTIESSHVYKLVPVGKIRLISEKYHQIMYDKNKYKIVPYPVLNANKEIKEWFFEGYYTGDGYKSEKDKIIPSNGSIRMDCKGKIGTQGLYLLLKSIGYKNVSINTRESKPDIFRINASKGSIRKSAIAIKKIIPLADTTYTDYVYDLETEEGIFHAGIGELVVKNTDSNYVNFPQLKSAQECWDYSIKVAKDVSSLFPKPMSLAFEEKVYWRFFILTKKRYMSQGCKRDGVLDKEIGKKGVLLQRRDNCSFVRKIYGDVVMMIFNKRDREDIVNYILDELNKLCGAFYPVNDFVVTKSIGEVGELEPHEGKDKNDKPCYKIGDYKVKLLPTDERKREQQFKLKNCSSEKDYYLRSLPAQVQLAEKMRERGQLVSAGSRLEYVITTTGGHTAKQYIKVEDRAYFSKHSGSLSIDYLYYLKQLSNPLDQILDIIFSEHEKGFILKQYKYRLQVREKVLSELRGVFTPRLIFNGK
jgi:DNA polymerase elongation subunit (family B)